MAVLIAAAAFIVMADPPVFVANLFMPANARSCEPENGADKNT